VVGGQDQSISTPDDAAGRLPSSGIDPNDRAAGPRDRFGQGIRERRQDAGPAISLSTHLDTSQLCDRSATALREL
jgi:hypothetical protein